MPKHYEERIMPYSQQNLFNLVADVQSYPSFIPWCSKAKIYEQSSSHLVAKLFIGKGPIQEAFTSHVELQYPEKIKILYKDGPLKYLKNNWIFTKENNTTTKVCFDIDFELKSPILNLMMSNFFKKAFFEIMTSFESEAYKRFS